MNGIALEPLGEKLYCMTGFIHEAFYLFMQDTEVVRSAVIS